MPQRDDSPRRKTEHTERKQTMYKADFSKRSSDLDDDSKKEAIFLLEKRDEILDRLVRAGLTEDEEHPYTYNVPTALYFDCGKSLPMRSLWAIVVMARASFSDAYWLDCDKDGFPECGPIGCDNSTHRVYITDPFALHIDSAIKRYQEKMVREGKARIVNGRFFKIA